MAAGSNTPPRGDQHQAAQEAMRKDPGRHSEDVRPARSGLPTGSMVGALEGVGTTDRRQGENGPRSRQPFSDPSDRRTPLEIATEIRDPEQAERDKREAKRRNKRNEITVDYVGVMALEVDGELLDPRSGPTTVPFNETVLVRPFTAEEEERFRPLNRRADDRGFSDMPTIQPGRETEGRGEPRHRGQPTKTGIGSGQVASNSPGGPVTTHPVGGGPVAGNVNQPAQPSKVNPQKGNPSTDRGLPGAGGTANSGTRAPGDGPENR